jgi:hypothetical protein
MQPVPQQEHQAAQAVGLPSLREIGLIPALALATGPPLEQDLETIVPAQTARKSARFPVVAVAPV